MLCTYSVSESGDKIISNITHVGVTIPQIIKKLKKDMLYIDTSTVVVLLCMVVLGVISLLTYHDLMLAIRMNRLRRQANQGDAALLPEDPEQLTKNDVLYVDDYLCSACKSEMKTVICFPCKHVNFCKGCYDKQPDDKKNTCNSCQKEVKKITVLFAT